MGFELIESYMGPLFMRVHGRIKFYFQLQYFIYLSMEERLGGSGRHKVSLTEVTSGQKEREKSFEATESETSIYPLY